MLFKKIVLFLCIIFVVLESKKKKNKKHDEKHDKKPTTTSWYYWIEWAQDHSKNYGSGDWSQWIPPSVTGYNNNDHKHDSKDHKFDSKDHHHVEEKLISDIKKDKSDSKDDHKNNDMDSPYYNGAPVSNNNNVNQPISYQPPMDSYPEGQQYQQYGGSFDVGYSNNPKSNIEKKTDQEQKHDFFKYMCDKVNTQMKNNQTYDNEDKILCLCRESSMDKKGFDECMHDKNGDNWQQMAATRIEYWSQLYEKEYDPNYNNKEFSASLPKAEKEQNSSKIDFSLIAIISLILSVVFMILFSYQCFKFSWKSWKLRGYETVGKPKSKVVFIGEKTSNVV